MKLVITLNQNELQLEIRQKGRVIDPVKPHCGHGVLGRDRRRRFYVLDSETALYYHDLSEVLITSLDKLLKRNNIDPVKSSKAGAAKRQFDGVDTTALNSFKIQGNTGKNSTSYKIAAAFIEGLKTFMK